MHALLQARQTKSARDAVRACVAIGEGLFANADVHNYKKITTNGNTTEGSFSVPYSRGKSRSGVAGGGLGVTVGCSAQPAGGNSGVRFVLWSLADGETI